jgi:hypothetical protein
MLFVSPPLAVASSHSFATGMSAAPARVISPATAFPQSSYPLVTVLELSVGMTPPPWLSLSLSLPLQDRDDVTSYASAEASSRRIQWGGVGGHDAFAFGCRRMQQFGVYRGRAATPCHCATPAAALPPLQRHCQCHCRRAAHAVVDAAATPLGGKRRRGSRGGMRCHGN